MLRALVVVREAGAGMPDGRNRLCEIDKTHWRRRNRFLRWAFAENGMQRVLGENVLDISDEQFLMLLFVMNAEDHNRFDLVQQAFRG